MKRLLCCLAASAAMFAAPPARADFASCVGSLKAEAARAGISARTLGVAFDGLQPDMKVLDLQGQQPEFKTPVWDYVDGLTGDDRVADGKAAMAAQARALARAEEQFGVSRYMLAAIWGVESRFGQKMGARPLVQSLTTLACFGGRARYFRSELMATLKIIDRGDVPADKLNGSWAGRSGRPSSCPRPSCASRSTSRATGGATSSIRRPTRSPPPPTICASRAGARGSHGASRSNCRTAIRGRRGEGRSNPCPSGRRGA